eukprot:gb/GECG01002425.1/.p1 GENE.gb/GECG01002425.1/~~gb/GECG01002425.1/.p1  ORF type:complete len:183 (+),score=21.84 gb/GECG01002425.1/:1-549(+)
MPGCYHSRFNEAEAASYREVAGCAILPARGAPRGPAPASQAPSEEELDIVDEAIDYFRANVLFNKFEIEAAADRTLVYLMMFVQLCLKTVQGAKTKSEASRQLEALAQKQQFPIPGDPGWPLGRMFATPEGSEKETIRSYFKQMREVITKRLPDRLFFSEDEPNKFWMGFAKKKFVGKELSA